MLSSGKAMQAMEHAMACAPHQQPHQQQQPQQHQLMQPHQHYLPHHHQQHPHHHQQQHPQQLHQHQPQQLDDDVIEIPHKPSKDFADKPELDVRQFLANWDETEEEDGVNGNLQNVSGCLFSVLYIYVYNVK